MGRKALLLVLVLVVGLTFAAFALSQTVNVPTISEKSHAFENASEAEEAVAIQANLSAESTNESETNRFWREWKIYNKSRFQVYVNRTRIEWYEKPNKRGSVGRILVGGKSLWNGTWDNKSNKSLNPLDFFENKSRKGNCAITAAVNYELLRVKGENVREVGAKRSTESSAIISGHAWVEIEIDNQWYVIDFNQVILFEKWSENSVWTIDRGLCQPFIARYFVTKNISELCAKYENLEVLITCEEAADLALSKYPGNILSVEKTQIDIPLPPDKGGGSELIYLWVISIDLKEPTEKSSQLAEGLEVMVDTTTGEVKGFKPLSFILVQENGSVLKSGQSIFLLQK
jgi:hypothetical protein